MGHLWFPAARTEVTFMSAVCSRNKCLLNVHGCAFSPSFPSLSLMSYPSPLIRYRSYPLSLTPYSLPLTPYPYPPYPLPLTPYPLPLIPYVLSLIPYLSLLYRDERISRTRQLCVLAGLLNPKEAKDRYYSTI